MCRMQPSLTGVFNLCDMMIRGSRVGWFHTSHLYLSQTLLLCLLAQIELQVKDLQGRATFKVAEHLRSCISNNKLQFPVCLHCKSSRSDAHVLILNDLNASALQ